MKDGKRPFVNIEVKRKESRDSIEDLDRNLKKIAKRYQRNRRTEKRNNVRRSHSTLRTRRSGS